MLATFEVMSTNFRNLIDGRMMEASSTAVVLFSVFIVIFYLEFIFDVGFLFR